MTPGFMEIPQFAQSFDGADFSLADGRVVPAFNTPLALYLVREACSETHGVYSSNCGRYARVRICAAEGWVAPAGSVPPTVEDIAEHIGQIGELGNYSEPMTPYDEFSAAVKAARKQGVLA